MLAGLLGGPVPQVKNPCLRVFNTEWKKLVQSFRLCVLADCEGIRYLVAFFHVLEV